MLRGFESIALGTDSAHAAPAHLERCAKGRARDGRRTPESRS